MSEKKLHFEFSTEQRKNRSCTIYSKTYGEIRGIEDETFDINGKEIHKLWLAIEGESGERFYLSDREMSHKSEYKRGMKGTFAIRIDIDDGYKGKTKISIIGFKEE